MTLRGKSINDVAIIVKLCHKQVATSFLSIAIPPCSVVRREQQRRAIGTIYAHRVGIASCHIAVVAVVYYDVLDRDGIESSFGIVPGSTRLSGSAHINWTQPLQGTVSADFHQETTIIAAILLTLKLPGKCGGNAGGIGYEYVAGAHIVGVSHLGSDINASIWSRDNTTIAELAACGIDHPLEVAVTVSLYQVKIVIIARSLVGCTSANLLASIVNRERRVAEFLWKTTITSTLCGAREHHIIDGITRERHVATHCGRTCLKEMCPTSGYVINLRCGSHCHQRQYQ